MTSGRVNVEAASTLPEQLARPAVVYLAADKEPNDTIRRRANAFVQEYSRLGGTASITNDLAVLRSMVLTQNASVVAMGVGAYERAAPLSAMDCGDDIPLSKPFYGQNVFAQGALAILWSQMATWTAFNSPAGHAYVGVSGNAASSGSATAFSSGLAPAPQELEQRWMSFEDDIQYGVLPLSEDILSRGLTLAAFWMHEGLYASHYSARGRDHRQQAERCVPTYAKVVTDMQWSPTCLAQCHGLLGNHGAQSWLGPYSVPRTAHWDYFGEAVCPGSDVSACGGHCCQLYYDTQLAVCRSLGQNGRESCESQLINVEVTHVPGTEGTHATCTWRGEQEIFAGHTNPPEVARSYSSVWGNEAPGTGHARSRLDSPQAWSAAANNAGEWLTIDAGSAHDVIGVETQGRTEHGQFVTQYTVQVSLDGRTFSNIDGGAVFVGNSGDGNAKVRAYFAHPVEARYVRIIVHAWVGHISMRAGLLVQDTGGWSGGSWAALAAFASHMWHFALALIDNTLVTTWFQTHPEVSGDLLVNDAMRRPGALRDELVGNDRRHFAEYIVNRLLPLGSYEPVPPPTPGCDMSHFRCNRMFSYGRAFPGSCRDGDPDSCRLVVPSDSVPEYKCIDRLPYFCAVQRCTDFACRFSHRPCGDIGNGLLSPGQNMQDCMACCDLNAPPPPPPPAAPPQPLVQSLAYRCEEEHRPQLRLTMLFLERMDADAFKELFERLRSAKEELDGRGASLAWWQQCGLPDATSSQADWQKTFLNLWGMTSSMFDRPGGGDVYKGVGYAAIERYAVHDCPNQHRCGNDGFCRRDNDRCRGSGNGCDQCRGGGHCCSYTRGNSGSTGCGAGQTPRCRDRNQHSYPCRCHGVVVNRRADGHTSPWGETGAPTRPP